MTQRDLPVQDDETPVTAALRTLARIMGWAVMHTTDGGHTETSYHYVGRAVDLAARSGPGVDTSELLAINEGVVQVLPLSMISELIYSGPGNVCVKNGRIISGLAAYGADTMSRHHNHVHLAVVANFTYNGPERSQPVDTLEGGAAMAVEIVGFQATPSGQGYWILTSNGGLYAFGDAQYLGGLRIDGDTVEAVKPEQSR